jgi:hypothetical protein
MIDTYSIGTVAEGWWGESSTTNSKSIVFFSAQNGIFSIGDHLRRNHTTVLKNSNVEKIFCMYDSYVDLRCRKSVLSAEKKQLIWNLVLQIPNQLFFSALKRRFSASEIYVGIIHAENLFDI